MSQKIRWRMIKDRNPLLTTFADKLAVRDYVAERVGTDILARLYAVVDDPDDLDFDALPGEFVLKPNHGSHALWIVTRHAPPGGRFPAKTWDWGMTHPHETDRARLIAAARGWLGSNLGREVLERAYVDVQPRLLVEELLSAESGTPVEYKLWVFHGKVRVIKYVADLLGDHHHAFYSPNWERLARSTTEGRLPDPLPFPPDSLDRMIEIAERLGQGVDFVRVDLYDVDGRVVFGELTNYPAGGTDKWDPPTFDEWMGSLWHLD